MNEQCGFDEKISLAASAIKAVNHVTHFQCSKHNLILGLFLHLGAESSKSFDGQIDINSNVFIRT